MGRKSAQKRLTDTEPVQAGSLPLGTNPNAKNWLVWQGIAIFITAFVLYANTLGNAYALDDMIVLTKNTFTTQGIDGIDEIMTTDAFQGFFGDNYQFVAGGRYRPLSMVTFAIEYELFGGLEHPWVYHFNNIILYGITCVLILLTLQRLFRSKFEGQYAWLTVPFIAAFIFTAHPIHTEVVANIKGRDEIMGMLGAIATLYLCVRYAETDKIGYYFASLPLFFLALLSKENAITYLAVIPLVYFFFLRVKDISKYALVTMPLLVVAAAYILMRAKFTPVGITSESTEILNNPFVGVNFADRMATVAYTFGKYLQLLIFPHPLTYDYYPWQVPIYTWADWQAILPTLVWLAIGFYAIKGLLKRDAVAFGIIYFVVTVSIVSNIFFSVGIAMNERFVFMPSLGFGIVAAVLLVRFTNYLKTKNFESAKLLNPKPILIVLAVLAFGYSAKTITRNMDWKNDFTLFGADVINSPNSAKVQNAWGGELYTASDTAATPERRQQYLLEAEKSLKRAIEIHPAYSNAWLLLGNVYYAKDKDYKKAAEHYMQARNFNPNSFDAHFNLAIAYRDLNQFQEALKYLDLALQIKPEKTDVITQNKAELYYRWGKYAGKDLGDLQTAVQKINQAIQIYPKAPYYYEDLAVAYGLMGDFNNAIKACEAGLKIDPNYIPFYQNLAVSYNELGNTAKSQEYANKAEQLKGKSAPKP